MGSARQARVFGMKNEVRAPNPEHLRFLAAYDKRVVELALATRRLVLEEAPDAIELVYDAYSAVSAGYSFTGKPSESFVYVAAYTKRVNLGLWWGALMKDPHGLLQGTGNQSRHLPIDELADLRKPYVRGFLKAAIKMAERPQPGKPLKIAPGSSIVRAVYAHKRRPV
jgi:hypothetical protein